MFLFDCLHYHPVLLGSQIEKVKVIGKHFFHNGDKDSAFMEYSQKKSGKMTNFAEKI